MKSASPGVEVVLVTALAILRLEVVLVSAARTNANVVWSGQEHDRNYEQKRA